MQHNAHNHYADQQVKQHPEFDHVLGVGLLGQGRTDQIDAVFHHQIADDLGDRLAPGHEQKQAGGQRGDGGNKQQGMAAGQGDIETVGDIGGQNDEGQADDQRGVIADKRLHLPFDFDLLQGNEHKPGDEHAFNQNHDLQKKDAAGPHALMLLHKQRHQRYHDALHGHQPHQLHHPV